MNGKKLSAARTAPFGTDVQPTCNVKIIGGRAVEIPIEPPAAAASSVNNNSGEDQPPVYNGPHGSPLKPIKPHAYDGDSPGGQQSKEQYERLRAVASKTSPPDKSNSHIHGTRSRSGSLPCALRILPPILKSDRQSTPPPTSGLNSSSESLGLEKPKTMTMQLCEMLKGYDAYCFKDMYSSLAEFDHKLTGYVNQAQLNMIALRHSLPIPTTMMRLLFTSFSKGSNPDMVNYEKLLQYLARAQLGSAKADTMLNESVNRFINDVKTLDGPDEQVTLDEKIAQFEATIIRNQQPSHDTSDVNHRSMDENHGNSGDHQQFETKKERCSSHGVMKPLINIRKPLKVFSERDDAMLLMLVEQQVIQGKEESIDLDVVRDTMSDYDKSRDGTISHKQLQEVCLKHRLPLQGSLLDRIIMKCDTGESKLSWIALIEFLSKVKSLKTSQEPRGQSSRSSDPARPGTWPATQQVEESLQPPWETRKPLGPVMRKPSPTSIEQDVMRDDTPSPTIDVYTQDAMDAYQQQQLNALAMKQQALRAQSLAKADTKLVEEVQSWFSRFMHLAQGLYNSDSTNTGYLEKEEIVRLVNNYNLIYDLRIPQDRIMRVINSCVGVRGNIMIEPVLESLRLG